MMLVEEAKKCSFVLVGNIPSDLRSADLRAFFSHLVELGSFVCFHFKHRPEYVPSSSTAVLVTEDQVHNTTPEPSTSTSNDLERQESNTVVTSELSDTTDDCVNERESVKAAAAAATSSRCCVAAVRRDHEGEMMRRYGGGRHWAKAGGALVRSKVKLTRLHVSFEDKNPAAGTSDGKPNIVPSSSPRGIPWTELSTLPELNPPRLMPSGNVGTPTTVFLDLIRQCQLPGSVIKKLRLEFPKSRSKRRYGAVGLDYDCGQVFRGTDHETSEKEDFINVTEASESEEKNKDKKEDEYISPDDDHDAEEWERYEALHDDVDKQGRTKERLYEEEMEVVWEKGGSGLVFYTDASHWHNLEGDFDEQCSKEDDWDVDTAIYYDPEGGDKESRDHRNMREEQRIEEGGQQTSVFAGFERYTKGVGSKVLKRSGWREGSGLGRSSVGRAEPVDTDGQHPKNKSGLGYRGETLLRHGPEFQRRRKQRATRDVVISTVYDKREEEETTVLRSAPPRTIKYRQQQQILPPVVGGIKFVVGKPLPSQNIQHSSADSR